ncbi:MAG: hypothetical protein ACI976_002122 [Aureispira sp.]|jgi:hypothetical protein
MNKSMLFLTVLFVAVIGYQYLSYINPDLVAGGIIEGAVVVVTLLFAALKLRGTTEKAHNYSSPRGTKKAKNKKNPFFLD